MTPEEIGWELIDRYMAPIARPNLAELAADYGLTAKIAAGYMLKALNQIPSPK